MGQWFTHIAQNWSNLAVPLILLLASLVIGLSTRRFAYLVLIRWARRKKREEGKIVARIVKTPLLIWWLLLGSYLAVQVSELSSQWTALAGQALGSILVISLAFTGIALATRLLQFYLGGGRAVSQTISLVVNVIQGTILLIALLLLLNIWGVPTIPIIVILGAVILAIALAVRGIAPDFLSGLQLNTESKIKLGDYIKLDSGEEGYVTEITWRSTQIEAAEGNTIIIPHSKLMRSAVTNYGRPPKQAKEPFHFRTRLHLKELTGLKASNLRELVDRLKKVPDSVVYYHTHHFLEEHHYLTPEPPNDFSGWVSDVLGDEVLEERLASIDTFEFPTIGALRARVIGVIEEHLAKGQDLRTAPEGQEFYFIKSVSVILPTPYVAHDLREFLEVLRKITIHSLYFHIFEAKLRLQRGLNDFSIWLEDSLEEKELAEEIARLDPYTYTLETLRAKLIELAEERLAEERLR